jgi:type IV pilus assembly protein PilW
MNVMHRMNRNAAGGRRPGDSQSGMSLVELMVAITIGAILMTGLVMAFNNSNESRRVLERTGYMIENGRYATSLLYEDIRHAGFYGHYYDLGAAPATLPDPCETATLANLREGMAVPLQAYRAPDFSTRPDLSATTCVSKGLLTAANLVPGSDVLVIRRASTAVFTGSPTTNQVYIQSNVRDAELLLGNSAATVPAQAANNVAQSMRMYPAEPANTTPADTRRLLAHVYFVAPCSLGSGANGVCATGDDAIPTLKRLELSAAGGSTAMEIAPLVEGIQLMKIEYGLDTVPAATNTVTGLSGDSVPDSYVTTPGADQWPLVVSVRVHLLARTIDGTQGYTDLKQLTLASGTVGPFNDTFQRQVYVTEARPMNLAGRREVPK